ncbi:MAG: hypothetical protein AB7T49_01085 [Oligoflexales bacterium]
MLLKYLTLSLSVFVSSFIVTACSVEETEEEKLEAEAADLERQAEEDDLGATTITKTKTSQTQTCTITQTSTTSSKTTKTTTTKSTSSKTQTCSSTTTATPETGESAECISHKTALANQGIFIHSSGLRVRYVNTRLSFANSQLACKNSSGVLSLKLATPAQLSLVKNLFVTSTGKSCKTDVWSEKLVRTTVTPVTYLLPNVAQITNGKDAKAVCVVQE